MNKIQHQPIVDTWLYDSKYHSTKFFGPGGGGLSSLRRCVGAATCGKLVGHRHSSFR